METSCACKGIRTCLICEHLTGDLTEPATIKVIYIYCDECETAWIEGAHEHGNHHGDNIPFPGVCLLRKFISTEQEAELTACIDKTPWVDSQSGRRKQDYGPKVNFKKKKVKLSVFSGLPAFSKKLVEQMNSTSQLKDFIPVELCNLEYLSERGSAIDPHFDDFWLWGERLVTLTLLSDTYLSMTIESRPDVEVLVPMPRLSLIVVFGPARFEWQHAVKREHIQGRRLGITFRELTPEFLEGGAKADLGKELIDLAFTFNGHAVGSAG